MKAMITPSGARGWIQAPASKSSMQRACAAALVRQGRSRILNPGHSNDDKAAIGIIQALGATVQQDGEEMIIESRGVRPVASSVYCGESGLSIRMFTPIIALSDQEISIQGSGSLVSRPMDFFDQVLPQLGVRIRSNGGKLPMKVQGPLQPCDIEVDGSLSSQFLTGLLMAFAGAGASGVSILVRDLKSKPYIDLTLEVMKQFGLPVPEHDRHRSFHFPGRPGPAIDEVQYTVEGDWSGGAFLLVAGAIAGPVTVRGLDPGSTQADRAILDALMAANAAVAMDAKGITVHPGEMDGFYFDATDCPDLFPPLVALAAYCKGSSRIKGVSRLTHKESNRAFSLQEEFDKMGLWIELEDDLMTVHGGGTLKGADFYSHHDHRIAMATAVAALGADSVSVIEGAEAVNKSYPDFFEDLKKLGAGVSLDNKISLHE